MGLNPPVASYNPWGLSSNSQVSRLKARVGGFKAWFWRFKGRFEAIKTTS